MNVLIFNVRAQNTHFTPDIHGYTMSDITLFLSPVIHHGLCRCQKLSELLIQIVDDERLVLEPLISLLHLGGVGVDLVAELGDCPQHVLAGECRRLIRLGELRVQLKKLSEL